MAQNCGNNNPVLVLSPNMGVNPPTLTLKDAWSIGGDWKHHIQAADLNNDWVEEVYVSGNNGVTQCLLPDPLPGQWNCQGFGGNALQRSRGMYYSLNDQPGLYILDTPNDWNQNGLRRCEFNGNCTNVVTNNDLQPLGGLVLDDPQDVARDPVTGDFFITDSSRQVIGRLTMTPSITYTPVFGVEFVPYVTDPGYLNNPISVIVDAQNNLYVAEQQGRRIISYDPAGAIRWEWGVPGVWMNNEATEICQPQGTMDFDPTGNLYVADRCNGRVVVLNPANGALLELLPLQYGRRQSAGLQRAGWGGFLAGRADVRF